MPLAYAYWRSNPDKQGAAGPASGPNRVARPLLYRQWMVSQGGVILRQPPVTRHQDHPILPQYADEPLSYMLG